MRRSQTCPRLQGVLVHTPTAPVSTAVGGSGRLGARSILGGLPVVRVLVGVLVIYLGGVVVGLWPVGVETMLDFMQGPSGDNLCNDTI